MQWSGVFRLERLGHRERGLIDREAGEMRTMTFKWVGLCLVGLLKVVTAHAGTVTYVSPTRRHAAGRG